jgi:hypothetical protein
MKVIAMAPRLRDNGTLLARRMSRGYLADATTQGRPVDIAWNATGSFLRGMSITSRNGVVVPWAAESKCLAPEAREAPHDMTTITAYIRVMRKGVGLQNATCFSSPL